MDEQRFDLLSRRLAGYRTRRQALKAIAGAIVATVAVADRAGAQSCTPHYTSCADDSACCAGAVCQYGLCMPGCRIDGAFVNAWTSPPGDICQQCLPEVSTTNWTPANDGMSCWSGDATAGATTCQAGACVPVATGCPPPTACHLDGSVDATTGQCVYPPAPAGTPCGNGPMCHGGFFQPADACDGAGFCVGGGATTANCAPYLCGEGACATSCATDGECTDGAVCCGERCVYVNTIDHCSGCGDACAAADACTPAQCLDNGSCNQMSVCTGFDTCGGGGEAGQCGCTPDNPICQQSCDESNGCGGACAGGAATNPAIALTFAPTADPRFCLPTVHLTGFAGCTSYTAEYFSDDNSSGSSPTRWPDASLNTTSPIGASSTGVATFLNENRWLEIKIGSVSSGWQQVICAT